MSSHSDPLPVGYHINNRYELTGLLGRGKYGQVHRAHDEHLDTEVAIKLLEPVNGQVATWDEAQLLEQLQGDFLLHVYNADVVHDSDIRFITTPVMEGGDLQTAIKKSWADTRQASRWGQQIARGLDRVHSAGLLHRDVKPGNAYLDSDNNAQLGDLGIAARWDANGQTPPAGTMATVAPEVIAAEDGHCSVKSDVYSLAASTFYLLTGEYPVDHKLDQIEHARRVRDGKIRNLRDLAPQVPASIARVVMKSLSMDPATRAESAHQFANHLASASHYSRNWRRVGNHGGHQFCLRSDVNKRQKSVSICVVPNSKMFDIMTTYEGGRQINKFTVLGVPHSGLAAALRRSVKGLG